MIQQQSKLNTQAQVAQADPMLRFAELLIKINKREQVVEKLTKGQENENDQ